MVPMDVVAALKVLRKKWRREAGVARKAFDACKFEDSRYQQRGEEIAYDDCANDVESLIYTIEESQRQ